MLVVERLEVFLYSIMAAQELFLQLLFITGRMEVDTFPKLKSIK